jgi:hypothetical protein
MGENNRSKKIFNQFNCMRLKCGPYLEILRSRINTQFDVLKSKSRNVIFATDNFPKTFKISLL